MWCLEKFHGIIGFYSMSIILSLHTIQTAGLFLRVDPFTDVSKECSKNDYQLNYILNEDKPAMYISIDPNKSKQKALWVSTMRKLIAEEDDESVINAMKKFQRLGRGSRDKDVLKHIKSAIRKILRKRSQSMHYANKIFDCSLQFETEKPLGDKMGGNYDALSLIIVELSHNVLSDFTSNQPPCTKLPSYQACTTKLPCKFFNHICPGVEVITSGKNGITYRNVTKRAEYSERIWPGINLRFSSSGRLSGSDSIDNRTKIDPQHIVKPENLYSYNDTPAKLTINIKDWTPDSHIYMIITSYKYLRQGETCRKDREFDCTNQSFFIRDSDHMCVSMKLACDGMPNCGQDHLPNMDENCFKIHRSSLALPLVSYTILALVLLLFLGLLGCFIIKRQFYDNKGESI